MINNSAPEDLVFEVITPLGFTVRVTRVYWELIISIKHPVMSGHESDVKETLADPDEIRVSRSELVDGFVQWQKGLIVRAF